MTDSTISLFTKEFGKALEKEYNTKFFEAVSANRWLAIGKSNLYSNYRRFSIQQMPKPDKNKVETVKYGKIFFNLKVIRKILNLFFNNESFEIAINYKNNTNVMIFKLGHRCIIFAEMIDNHKTEYYEIEYKWNDIFLEFTKTSDMIL